MRTRLLKSTIVLSFLAFGWTATVSQAASLTLVGQVTECTATLGEECFYPVGTPTLTRVTFDHQRVRPFGAQAIPIGQAHGSLDIWVDGEHWDETQDFEYWNEETPWSPRDGWYSPVLIFRDGLFRGVSFFVPDEFETRGFQFYLGGWSYGPYASGVLALEPPRFLPEPGTGLLFATGLLALVQVRRRNRWVTGAR